MFGKKKPIVLPPPEHDYQHWESDFGFLNLILQRKKKIVEEFLINPSDKQLDGKSYLNDDDIEPMVESSVREAVSQIGDEYKNFLIKHYFGNEENMLVYITEDFYVDFVNDAVKRNSRKIKFNANKKAIELVKKMNNAK